jgi:MFS family permease
VEAADVLRLPAFRNVAAAYTINELGNWIGDVALAILVFDRTGSPIATAGLFLALRFAPALLAPPLTTRIEIVAPRQMLPALYLGEALIFALIAILARSFSLPAVLALAALDGVLAVAAKALIRSVNATILSSPELLRRGNAILNLGLTIGGAIGPAVAGGLVAGAGAGTALALDAGTFALVAVLLALTKGLRIDSNADSNTLGRLRSGLRETWTRPAVRRLLIATAIALMFGTSVIPIEVVFAKRTLHAGDTGYGFLITAWGVGMVVGGAAFAAGSRVRLTFVISAGVALIAAGYAGLAGSSSLLIACVFSAVGGIGNGLWWIAAVTALQQSIPIQSQSVVMSLLESTNQVMPALGYVVGGAVTAASSPRVAYAVAAVGVAVVFIVQMLRPFESLGNRPTSPDSTTDDSTRRRVRPRSSC